MSREGIDNVRYEIQNWFIKEYTCHTETRIENEERIIYERDPENKRKRKRISDKWTHREYLVVTTNGRNSICYVFGNSDCGFKIFLPPKHPNGKEEADITCQTAKETSRKIEEICRKYYFDKYGETRPSYSGRRKFKRLSVSEICDWYNEFRKTDMTIAEIKEAIQIKEEIKNERLSFDDVKTALKIHKTIKKLYNI